MAKKASFGRLSSLAKKKRGLTMREALSFCFKQKKVQDYVIFLNTDDQLFQRGVDSKGTDLYNIGGDYSPQTRFRKIRQGLPHDRVTLYETGEFYDSFKVKAQKDGFVIEADTIKTSEDESEDLRDRWGQDIIGLTDENKADLGQVIRPYIRDYILEKILGK